jgi:hypothetical protein
MFRIGSDLTPEQEAMILKYVFEEPYAQVVSDDPRMYAGIEVARLVNAEGYLELLVTRYPHYIAKVRSAWEDVIRLKTERRARRRVARWLGRIAKTQERKKRQLNVIKEELMETAWHPSRVEKWVEADAIDMMIGL